MVPPAFGPIVTHLHVAGEPLKTEALAKSTEEMRKWFCNRRPTDSRLDSSKANHRQRFASERSGMIPKGGERLLFFRIFEQRNVPTQSSFHLAALARLFLSETKCDVNLSNFAVPSASQPYPAADERDENSRHESVPQQQFGTLAKAASVFHLQVWWTCHKAS